MRFDEIMGGAMGFGERPAVVVVDETIAFTHPSSPLCCDDGSAVAATKRLLDAAREADVPIIFSSVVVGERERASAAHFLRKMPGLMSITDDPDRTSVDPRLARRVDEPVIEKIFPSVFFETRLAELLQARDVDTLIVTGMSTSGCVRATAVDAVQHGFRTIVARDAVADRDVVAHDNALRDLGFKYADILDVDAIVAQIQRGTKESIP